ncbi:ribosomal protein S18 acetylase RimI-like enzyme [Saccharothrix tamanrassetensis]|uniref:Ribosomal protein S18 acetylase RimI-like enzyme n=1 Tax=Saccharothrix tamanrassetensis TaxID=1051531 RepID=A0A841CBF5_9PSEU|nr:GNAT family N-acetyltransferase [Saccharothrix tamanrassetensis]MBB5953507.1 ribosomal protein S18 acetylase RimI-like enzyme [Saccharothrix tamanrassetensis]
MTGPDVIGLDLSDGAVARAVHRVGLRSYAVEAELIGSRAIPALHETVDGMCARPLRWLGTHVDGTLAGFVAWARVDGVLDVARLCVDPGFFRRGLARRLVRAVLAEGGPAVVATGAANAPAIALYEGLGFRRVGTFEPEPGLPVAEFSRPGTP